MPKSLAALVFSLVVSAGLFAGQAMNAVPAFAADAVHKVAIHVDENDSARINMALNNVKNIKQYYDSIGQAVQIEVVAYGPGLHMLRADTSPVKDRISALSLEVGGLIFSGCGNTKAGMSKAEGKEIELLPEARVVPSGVIRLVELQEDGYSYVRP